MDAREASFVQNITSVSFLWRIEAFTAVYSGNKTLHVVQSVQMDPGMATPSIKMIRLMSVYDREILVWPSSPRRCGT